MADDRFRISRASAACRGIATRVKPECPRSEACLGSEETSLTDNVEAHGRSLLLNSHEDEADQQRDNEKIRAADNSVTDRVRHVRVDACVHRGRSQVAEADDETEHKARGNSWRCQAL